MAGNSGAIRAGRAYVEIYGDQAPLMSAMKSLPKSILAASAGLGAVGGVVGGLIASGITSAFSAVTSFASNLGEVGGRLVDMSDRTGIGVEALAELEHAAQMGGTSLESLEGGLTKMGVKLADAAAGSDSARAAFDAIGVSVGELQGMSPDQQFERIADGLASISDPGQRAAATMDIFGKSGADLIPLMKDGSAGIKAFREEAKRLGRITEEDARAVDELGDTFANVQSAMSNAATTVAAAFSPALNDLGQALIPVASWLGETARVVAPVVAGFGKAVSAVYSLSTAMELLNGAGLFIEETFGSIGTTFTATIAGLSEDFGDMFGTVGQGFQGLFDAIAAGDLAAAFEVQVATINLLWQQGLEMLGIDWVEIWATIEDTFNQATANIQTGWVSWTSSLASFWNDLVSTIQDIWDQFTGWLESTFVWVKKLVGAVSDEVAKEQQRLIAEKTDQKIGGRNASNEAANQKIAADSQAQQKAIQERRDARTAAIRNDAETNSSAKRLADAQARLDAATKAAADKRAAAEASKPVNPAAEMRKTAIAGTSAMFATSAGAISFGGVAAGMAANQGPINKLVDSSEETAENTRVIAKKIGNDGMRA